MGTEAALPILAVKLDLICRSSVVHRVVPGSTNNTTWQRYRAEVSVLNLWQYGGSVQFAIEHSARPVISSDVSIVTYVGHRTDSTGPSAYRVVRTTSP